MGSQIPPPRSAQSQEWAGDELPPFLPLLWDSSRAWGSVKLRSSVESRGEKSSTGGGQMWAGLLSGTSI